MFRSRLFPNKQRFAITPFGPAIAIQTVPTGFSSEPPSGPAIPETAMQ